MKIFFPKFNTKYPAPKFKAPVQSPINFKARCQESSFKLRDIPNLHCPVCGLVMLNKHQRKSFIDDVSSKTGENLVDALSKYEDETALVGDDPKNEHKTIYRPLKAKIIEVIKDCAKQNPKLNLLQIVRLKRDEFLAPLIKQQLDITFELEEYLESVEITEEEQKKIKGIIEDYKSRILGESEEEFKRKDYIHALSKVVQDPKIQEKIDRIIEKLPQSNNDVKSFFVKYSKEAKTPKEIASKFVNQSAPSTEHLKPKSKGGKNNTNNYIADCSECNSERCNTDFNIWLEQKPELASNLQKYVNQVQVILDEGNFSPIYDSYVEELIQTINRLSYGKLALKAPKSNNKRQVDTIYKKREACVDGLKDIIRNLSQRKREILEQIEALENNQNIPDITELEDIEREKTDITKKIAFQNKTLTNHQDARNEARKVLDEITMLHIHLSQGEESAREEIIKLDEKTNKDKFEEAEVGILKANKAIKSLQNKLNRLEKKEQAYSETITLDDETLEKIRKIAELKVELEIIEATMKHNEKILKHLRNFKDMSSLEFREYLSMVSY